MSGLLDKVIKIKVLTVTERAGSKLPKSSKMVITAEMSKIAQKQLKNRLPLKFKNEYFGARKMFEKVFFVVNFTGNELKNDRK